MNLFSILNGLTFAALLFIVASGFTLIFGLLRIVNLAHRALYLFGGLVGYSAAQASGMVLMREDGQRLVDQGITSAQELVRITRD